jgi:thiol-disulfide isomerase/thioredoxin
MRKNRFVAFAAIGLLAALAVGGWLVFRDSPASSLPRTLATGAMANFTFSDAPKPVPPVSFTVAGGAAADLAQFRGKVVLVNLWATWCAPCRAEMPAIDRLAAELGGSDFQVVALAEDRGGWDKARAYLDEVGASHVTLLLDQTMQSGRDWGARGLPITLLLDRTGREVGRMIGPADWESADAKALIRGLIEKNAAG